MEFSGIRLVDHECDWEERYNDIENSMKEFFNGVSVTDEEWERYKELAYHLSMSFKKD